MQSFLYRSAAACLLILCLVRCNDQPADKTAAATTDSTAITGSWKLGIQFWTFHVYPFLTAVEKADSAGIKNIEAFLGQPIGGDSRDTFGIRLSTEGRDKVKQLLRSKGMTMVAFGVVVPQSVQEWAQTFQLARDMGVQYITAEPLKSHWGIADSLAGVYGIPVAIHDHPRSSPYDHPDSVIAAMKGHPNLYACADLGHWARSGLDVVDCLKKLEGRIIGSHLKDVVAFNNPQAADTIPGKGVIRFPEVFAEFKRQQFKGMFSIEHESNWANNVPDVMEIVTFYQQQVAAVK
ncbi:MAG: sugar phosphate isomerase/epimerase [Candidatus Pseudobacter hemicellulosilyticus]|uniref:Sugar phosphate isomerase/epimerase n=1 Tax=Candidatus Pseudobacter hemicellulosilyticus TaxID=3121375 RepID=A0AAJ6BFJ2_9BACT|nr:MAG: sugar phosphate isomerase/epimerase [Pseudobacter sp.]